MNPYENLTRLLPPQGGLAEAARKGGYGQDTGSVYPSQAKCELGIMPSSHLPRTPCNKFVYDFPCDFLGIVGGYGLRHMCSHCLRASCDFFYGASGAIRGKSVQTLCGNCTEIVQCQCSCRAVSADSARKSYGVRAGIGLRTVPVRGLCDAIYYMSTGYGLTILFPICKTSR